MERFKSIKIILFLAVVLFASAALGKAASLLLQEGLYAEEVDGDLDAAIKLYGQIIADGSARRSHVAQAMYRQGMCYLKKQDEMRAQLVFGKLVADYSDQTKIVNKVKPMLEELSNGDPAALMPPETLIYVEIGSPGKQVETILNMLKGTPLENPLAAIGGAPQGGASPGGIMAGLLNPNIMAEFKKIRGIGVGITGVADNEPPIIIVLYPGKSDALRGLLMAALVMLGKPTEAIEGMQTVAFNEGGGASYDDSTVILASPKAYAAGQLTWCVKQHKGVTSEPTLASSNKSFAKVSRKDRQENALTIWANVDEVFAGLKKVMPEGEIPQHIRVANDFIDLEGVDDLIAFLSIEEDGIAIEANVGFKDGHHSVAYEMIRTPNLSKAGFKAVPSEAIALISVALGDAESAQAQMVSGKIEEMTGLEIGGNVFANIDQITLFALPPGRGFSEAVPGMPPIVASLGLVITSDNPQQTRQILTGLLTAVNLVASQSEDEQNAGRYQIELVNEMKLHYYVDQASKTSVLSLSPDVLDVSASAIKNNKSVATAGPLNNALGKLSPTTSKLALVNVGGAIRVGGAYFLLGMTDTESNELLAQLAQSCDKTTLQFRTYEEANNFNVRVEVSELPPINQLLGPITQLSQLRSEAKSRAGVEARRANIPAGIRETSQPPKIDGKTDDIWSQASRHEIRNVIYSPVSERSDLTANYRAMWDTQNLYVLVNVMDESLKNDSDEFWLDDGVEVFIDADNSKSDSYGNNDYQYFFEWADENPGMGEFKHDRTAGVEFAVARTERGYQAEIKIPWSTLGTKPSAGAKIGLDVHVNDDDDGGDRDSKVTWRGKEDNAWQTPQALGTANLLGTIAWLKLDEGEGGNASDSSGNNNDGALVGDPKWLPSGGKLGGALQFDGIDDYVDCGRDASLDITNEITIAAWVKTNDAGNSDFNPYVTKGDAAYGLKHHDTNNLEFVINDGAWHVAHYPVDSSFNGAWHHLVGTYDGKALKLYVDGTLKTTTPYPDCSIATNAFNLNIARNSEITERFYDGAIDDVRVYNYALGKGRITALYNEGK